MFHELTLRLCVKTVTVHPDYSPKRRFRGQGLARIPLP